MKKELLTRPEIKLVGLTARTNNKNEMNPQTAKIAELAGRYWGEGVAAQIQQRKHPGVTLAVYTDYASDEHGDYTYFIGEEVFTIDTIPANLETLIIPAARYAKFTTPLGKMPDVVISAWQDIWKMTPLERSGDRAYVADFELYDQRAVDPVSTSLDIYIGIK